MGTVKKINNSMLRYVVVPSFSLLEIAKEGGDKPDALRNLGTVFTRPDIIKTAQAHADFVSKQCGLPTYIVPSEAIKFCNFDELESLFKSVEVLDAKPKSVAIEVAKIVRK